MRGSRDLELLRQYGFITGYEDDGGDDSGEQSNDDDIDDDTDDDSGEQGGEGQQQDDADTEALSKALRAERKSRKQFERELKKLKGERTAEDDKDAKESDKQKARADKAETKATKLAERLRNASVEQAISKAATKFRFRDVDDAIRLVDRADIEDAVDQDEDDPSEIEVDTKSIEAAVKKLADKKPHLLVAEGDEEPSGSNVGSRGKGSDKLDDEKLREMYPTLRH